jgi:hypothetical protein
MTFSTNSPNLAGAIGAVSPTSVTLPVGEAALTEGTATQGGLAQASGLGAGFNVFTPTANATYRLVIRGQDVASGAATNAWVDVVVIHAAAGWAPVTVTSTTTIGAPGARTYSNNAGAFKHVNATGGTTWYIDIALTRFPA